MKYAKKMRLVEFSENDKQHDQPLTSCIKDEEYHVPHALQSLDKEMEGILNDSTIDVDQKWLLYHQALQRYLGFIKRTRQSDYVNLTDTTAGRESSPPDNLNTAVDNQQPQRFSFSRSVSHTTSTPKNDSEPVIAYDLPIRIKKRLIHKQKQKHRLEKLLRKKLNNNISKESTPQMQTIELNDDDEFYDDEGDSDLKTFNTPTGVAVNGWTKSNIIH